MELLIIQNIQDIKIKIYKYNIYYMAWEPIGIDGVFFISAGFPDSA